MPRLGAPAGSQKTKRGCVALLAKVVRHAGRQPAAADRQHDDVGRAPAGHLVGDLVADRRLALDDVLWSKGGTMCAPLHSANSLGGAIALVEEVADAA